MASRGGARHLHNTSANMIGPTLVIHGSDAQKAFFLPGIARGDISIALGYSEPDHGSDLAGIRTSAKRTEDGGWVVNGQKIFTSTAGFSQYVWLAARTDPANQRHGGISVFLVPLDTPGITIQPMSGLNGHRANVVFFDDVKLPADALVGPENGGWKLITDALAFERETVGAIGARARGYFDKLLAHVKADASLRSDPLVLDRIGGLGAEIEASRLLAVRTAQVVEQGEVPLWQAAMLKVYASELMERLSETAFDLLGPGATLAEGARAVRQRVRVRRARCAALHDRWRHQRDPAHPDRAARAGPALVDPAVSFQLDPHPGDSLMQGFRRSLCWRHRCWRSRPRASRPRARLPHEADQDRHHVRARRHG
jgi:alkylation response protein AidB-like acyl-CoA dehydrogenase